MKNIIFNNKNFKLYQEFTENEVIQKDYFLKNETIENWTELVTNYTYKNLDPKNMENIILENINDLRNFMISEPVLFKSNENGQDYIFIEMMLKEEIKTIIELTFQKWFESNGELKCNQYTILVDKLKMTEEWIEKESKNWEQIKKELIEKTNFGI